MQQPGKNMSGRAKFDDGRARFDDGLQPGDGLRNERTPQEKYSDDDVETSRKASREISLGMSGILILLLVLAVLCGGFFLFGYNVGRSAAQNGDSSAGISVSTDFSNFKPAPGSPAVQNISGYDANGNPKGADPATLAAEAEKRKADAIASEAVLPAVEATANPAPVKTSHATTPTVAVVPAPAPVLAATSATQPVQAEGPAIVQVATVSVPEDADVLLSALRKRGFAAVSELNSNDNLIHVQVGPFNTRQDAIVIQKRLLADGFNAVIR